MSASNCKALHALVAREEALEWGVFRNGPVTIAGAQHRPPAHTELAGIFAAGIQALATIADIHERAFATFLFGALHQFFWDGNKRTARLLMNGQLLAAGQDAVSIPARRQLEFNRGMLQFYDSRDASDMFQFLAQCSLDEGLRSTPGPFRQQSGRRSGPAPQNRPSDSCLFPLYFQDFPTLIPSGK